MDCGDVPAMEHVFSLQGEDDFVYLARVPVNRNEPIQLLVPDTVETGVLGAGFFDIGFLSLLWEPTIQKQVRETLASQVAVGRSAQIPGQLCVDPGKVDTGMDDGRSSALAGLLDRTSDVFCEMDGRCVTPPRQCEHAEECPNSSQDATPDHVRSLDAYELPIPVPSPNVSRFSSAMMRLIPLIHLNP
jgi:hypothetical protein